MVECNCRDYGFWREDDDDHHDNACAVALDREADKLDKALKREKAKVAALRAERKRLLSALRKADEALGHLQWYLDKEDSRTVVRSVNRANMAVHAALHPKKKG